MMSLIATKTLIEIGRRVLSFFGATIGNWWRFRKTRAAAISGAPLAQQGGLEHLVTEALAALAKEPALPSEWRSPAMQTWLTHSENRQHFVAALVAKAGDMPARGENARMALAQSYAAHTGSHLALGTGPINLAVDAVYGALARSAAARERLNTAVQMATLVHVMVPPPSAAVLPLASRRTPVEIPPASEQFFGREAPLTQLVARIRAGRNCAVVGPAGVGKTALAAEAIKAVVGVNGDAIGQSPFPDGVIYLDMYYLGGNAERVWHSLADKLAGTNFLPESSARIRAAEACHARKLLVVIEGGEEADGRDGRSAIVDLLDVLSPQNRWLLLTRLSTQAKPVECIHLTDALPKADAAALFDLLTQGRIAPALRDEVIGLLDGHPLAITWAGCLLAREEENPQSLLDDWQTERLPDLSDPAKAEHSLEWLFERSARGLDSAAQQALEVAGLIAHTPFSSEVIARTCSYESADAGGEQPLKDLCRRGLVRRTGNSWQFSHVLAYHFARKRRRQHHQLTEKLGDYFCERLFAAIGEQDDALSEILLAHSIALLNTDSGHRLRASLVRCFLSTVVHRLNELGRLDAANAVLNSVEAWLGSFSDEEIKIDAMNDERHSLFAEQGKVIHRQGNLEGAIARHRAALAISRRKYADNPTSASCAHNLTVDLNRIGDRLRDQGKLDLAMEAYEEVLSIREMLVRNDPNNDWLRYLGNSYLKIGDVRSRNDDAEGALELYSKSLSIFIGLVHDDPSNIDCLQTLAMIHNKIGDVESAWGDLADALQSYQACLEIVEILTAFDPSNAMFQLQLCNCLARIGTALEFQHQHDEAIDVFRKCLVAGRRLVDCDRSDAVSQRALSFGLQQIARSMKSKGLLVEALAHAQEGLQISSQLFMLDQTNAMWREDCVQTENLLEELQGLTAMQIPG